MYGLFGGPLSLGALGAGPAGPLDKTALMMMMMKTVTGDWTTVAMETRTCFYIQTSTSV